MKNRNIKGTGSENYFGDLTSRTFNNFSNQEKLIPSIENATPPKFPTSCRDNPNNISCRDPQLMVGKDYYYLPYIAQWFYDDYYTHQTIGDPDPALLHKFGYSVGNFDEIKRTWGEDTLSLKEQMGGRYDGPSRFHQEDTGYEDWYHPYPPNDLSNTWLRFNKGDEKITDFLLQRWVTEQVNDWPGTDYGRTFFPTQPSKKGPAFPSGFDEPKTHEVYLLKDASFKSIINQLFKLATKLRKIN